MPTDTQLLDWLERQNASDDSSGRCEFVSRGGRWTLHETIDSQGCRTIRDAILAGMLAEKLPRDQIVGKALLAVSAADADNILTEAQRVDVARVAADAIIETIARAAAEQMIYPTVRAAIAAAMDEAGE